MRKFTHITKIGAIIIVAAFMLLPILTFADTGQITINSNIPGVGSQDISTSSPCGWIVDFYKFALYFSGILAFGAIVFGGFMYATSAGNPTRQGTGRSYIQSALLGLLLLAAAYLILNVINPNLTTCSLPTLTNIGASGSGVGGSGSSNRSGGGDAGGAGASDYWGDENCASGPCQPLPNCIPSANINCGGAQGMVDTLSCIQQQDKSFTVTEGYPPTVAHTSAGHNNGCSVDVTVSSCANVQQLISAAQQCGAHTLNEYANCGGKTFGTTTGNNVHIDAKKGNGGC